MSAWFTTRRVIKGLLKSARIDVIVLYAVPTSGLQTLALARKYGVPVVFRAIDVLHRLVRYRFLKPFTRALEKRVYTRADRILAVAPRYAHYVTANGADESRVKLVLLPVDTDLFKPLEPDAGLLARWGLTADDAVIVFLGTLFHFSGLDGFIRALPQILRQVPDAKLLIVGDGPQRKKLEAITGELGLGDRVTMTGFQPYQTMPSYISLATLCINTFLNTWENADIFPGKIIQYLACGKAVLSTPRWRVKR